MNPKQILIKSVEHIAYKINIRNNEKIFQGRLKYILQKNNSDILVISFSAFPGKGSAKYNYMNTLQNIDVNRLFILDDFGYQNRGSYYLGENGNFFVEHLVIDLISQIIEQLQVKYVITIGSSKGGTCAIYFGLKLKVNAIIAGAPQYFIGDYLNIDKHKPILKGIIGENDEQLTHLNQLLPNEIKKIEKGNEAHITLYLQYSKLEPTYNEHIQYMLSDLKNKNVILIEDVKDFTQHSDVAIYFPDFLKNSLKSYTSKIENHPT